MARELRRRRPGAGRPVRAPALRGRPAGAGEPPTRREARRVARGPRRGADRDHRPHRAADRRGGAMPRAEARRLSRHRRTQLHGPRGPRRTWHRGAHDQGVRRYRGGRMRLRADVGGSQRARLDGPRTGRRPLVTHRRNTTARRDAGPGRLRRDCAGNGAARARCRHARGRLEPHAALDVFTVEPLPALHPFTILPNVTLSAHSAFRTPEASINLVDAALAHCRRIAAGRGA